MNVKNRDCISIHLQIDRVSNELICNLLDLFQNDFEKPVHKYEVIDFLVYCFKQYAGDFDETQVMYQFLKFKGIDPKSQVEYEEEKTENEV